MALARPIAEPEYVRRKSQTGHLDYRKAVGDPPGLSELMVFYRERAAKFCNDLGNQNEGYFDALVRVFAQALRSLGNYLRQTAIS